MGNSLGLRIPQSCATEAGVEAGSVVDVAVENGDLVVKLSRPRRYRLDELLDGVSAENIHGEVETGDGQGGEVW
ncbi:MAG: AbrB/MazE/SpoVT family DNA-binding domain-containing protein [Gammaproteobacteria bacterium]|nr:MAG: AbrB/MazE/SpoVT family DNA-binding domain-containing protein [Gammaproteobacteria bacterium]